MAKTVATTKNTRPNEASERAKLINPQLPLAGWNLSDRSMVRLEVPVTGYDTARWNGFTDFSLHDAQHRSIFNPFNEVIETAVREKRLVDFRVHQAQTGVRRKGIRRVDLSEEDGNAPLICSPTAPACQSCAGELK
jgi:hypothetical protein